MLPRANTSLRFKLALLAGVPVIGALLLAVFVVNDAREGARSAASLGSIENLAQLTAYIAQVLHAVQDERAASALVEGREAAAASNVDREPLLGTRTETDAAMARLEGFLSARDRSKLPPRLNRGLKETEQALRELAPFRLLIDGD